MTTQTTVTAAKAWAPDKVAVFEPAQVVPAALILTAADVVAEVEGDAPAVRMPFVPDNSFTTAVVNEGAELPESSPNLSELVVNTIKVGNLGRFSRELLAQEGAADTIAASMARAVTRKANSAFLTNAKSPAGLLAAATDAGTLGANLDAISDAVGRIEADGGTATTIICAPDVWNSLQKLKTAAGGNQPLLGAGLQAGERSLFGVAVTVSPDMSPGGMLIYDRSSVLAAVGSFNIAVSEDVYFTSDSVGVRATMRLGWGIGYPERVLKLSLAAA